jgi:hypothetical protein
VEFAKGASGISKDITDGHEEREETVCCSRLFLITVRKVC